MWMILGLCLLSIVHVRTDQDSNEFVHHTGYDDLDVLDTTNEQNILENESQSLDTDVDISDVPPANIEIPHIDRSLPPAEGLLQMIEGLQLGDKDKEYLRTNLLKRIELQKLLIKISDIDTEEDKIDEILPDGVTINENLGNDKIIDNQRVNIDNESEGDTLKVENRCPCRQMIILVSLVGALAFGLAFFVFKLYKCLMDREKKREEKKQRKQEKKKK